MKIAPAKVEPPAHQYVPTDLWPFLYLREPAIPALNLRGMAIVAALSVTILLAFAPVRRARPNATMFFLGAGFMLLETKGVVHMALLFGSTWVVNSIVFFAILSMILLSNLFVMAVRPERLWPFYVVLLASLLINVIVPMDTYLALPGTSKVIVSCLVVYLPVFFAGVIFGTLFRSSAQPDVDFGSNVGGIILGGLTEYLSLIFGFNALIGIAIGYYALSALFARRGGLRVEERRRRTGAGQPVIGEASGASKTRAPLLGRNHRGSSRSATAPRGADQHDPSAQFLQDDCRR